MTEAGTLPPVVPAGTTTAPIQHENEAPPRRLERPTNGLGRHRPSGRRGAWGAADGTEEHETTPQSNGRRVANGRRKRPSRGAGEVPVVPAPLAEGRAYLGSLMGSWEAMEAALAGLEDEES